MKALAVFLSVAAAVAPSAAGACRSGSCFSFLFQTADFRGDLAAPRVLWHFEKSFSFPSLRAGYAVGVSYGFKADKGSWEVSYQRSAHRATSADGVPASPVVHILELNGRSFLLRRSAFRPYFLGGICLPVLRLPRAVEYRGRTSSATCLGAGLNLGAGLAVDIGPRVVLAAGVLNRFVWFLYAYGGGKGRDINHLTEGYGGPKLGRLLRTSGLSWTASLGFIL
ncbi:MAG: hypothetical protein FJY80_06470 [Candidatus Aminicenantes bacterium]|nr:hypothetical protein [Candidatus Aminicenantes bacterium]